MNTTKSALASYGFRPQTAVMYKGEKFNSFSHLVGAALALVGLAILVVVASLQGDPWKIVSFSIYGATLVLLYSFSTLYHSLEGRLKEVFRQFDHIGIYLLIAGTYTPLTLVTLRGSWGWSIFGVVWGLAALGIALETWRARDRRILPVIIYIIMGWLILVALKPLEQALPTSGLTLLMLGGAAYSIGVIFYAFGNKVRYFHGIWHLFVLAGSLSHFAVILFYVA